MNNIEEIMLNIAKNINFFRIKRGLTQTELATKIGTTQSNISDYENGKKVSLPQLCAIANVLDISLEQLFYVDSILLRQVPFPVSKFDKSVYYCYYMSEDVVKFFELKLCHTINPCKARVKVRFQDDFEWLDGELSLDDKYAIVFIKIKKKNKHHMLTFNYYHDSENEKYVGGLSIYQTTVSNGNNAQIQICAISNKELNLTYYCTLKKKFLKPSYCIDFEDYCYKIKDTIVEEFYNTFLKG